MKVPQLSLPVKICMIYTIFGGLWILYSDRVLASFTSDPKVISSIQTYKGWVFVACSALLILLLLQRELNLRTSIFQKYQESEDHFQRLFANSMDAILLSGPDGHIYAANQAACKMFERTEEELKQLGRNCLVDSADPHLETILDKRARTGVYSGEISFLRKDGTRFPGEVSTNIFKDRSGEDRTSMIIRDITGRKRAESELQRRFTELEALYENGLSLSQMLSEEEISQQIIDVLSKKLAWSHAAIRVYRPETNKIILLAASRPAGDITLLETAITQLGEGFSGWVIEHGDPIRCGNVHNDLRYKQVFPEIQSGMYVPIWTGEPVCGCITVESEQLDAFTENDEQFLITLANQAGIAISNARLFSALQLEISERRMVEEQVRSLNTTLEQRVVERTTELDRVNQALNRALRMKDEFLASMSHELRTPLTGILGLSEALQTGVYGPLTEKQQQKVVVIETSGQHLLDLINDILDLSKLEANKLVLEIAPFVLGDICQASLQLVKGMAQKKRLKVTFSICPERIILNADGRRVKQILVNLLSNAVKFTPEGGSLGLEVEGIAEEGVVTLSVWDTGIGIKPEDLEKLFQPFVQIDSSLSRQQSGTGLGLALVQDLIELHGGKISVESTFGAGSRFIVTLPWDPKFSK